MQSKRNSPLPPPMRGVDNATPITYSLTTNLNLRMMESSTLARPIHCLSVNLVATRCCDWVDKNGVLLSTCGCQCCSQGQYLEMSICIAKAFASRWILWICQLIIYDLCTAYLPNLHHGSGQPQPVLDQRIDDLNHQHGPYCHHHEAEDKGPGQGLANGRIGEAMVNACWCLAVASACMAVVGSTFHYIQLFSQKR